MHSAVLKFPEKIFNVTSAFVMIFDAVCKLIWMNSAGKQFPGCCPADEEGNVWPFFLPEGREKFLFLIRRTLAGNHPDSLEIPVTGPDGIPKTVRWNTVLMEDEKKQHQRTVVVFGLLNADDSRKRTELQSTQERYRLFFENVGVGIMYIDEDSNIALVNKEFEKMTGYSKSETEGKTRWTALVAFEDDLERMKEYHRLRGIDPDRAPMAYDTKIRHKNGSVLDVVVRVTLIPQTTYRMVSFLDVTGERKAQEIMRESEAKLRSLFDHIRDGLYRCDSRGNIVFCNPSLARLIGYDRPEDLIGKKEAGDFYFSPAQRDEFLNNLNTLGEVTNYEMILKHKDGSGVIVLTDSRVLYDSQGKMLGVEGLLTDITRRRQTEKKLRENEERLQAITANIPGVVYQFEASDRGDYGITYISGRVQGMFGVSDEDSNFFQTFLARIHQDDKDRFLESIRKVVKTRSPWNFEGRFVRPSGELIWFQGLSTPVRYEDRIVFNGILLDITDRKKAEETFRQTEEKFYKVFATAPDCIAITRLSDGRIADVNLGFEGITGWLRDEVIGRTSLDIRFWVDSVDRHRMSENLLAGETIQNRQFQFRRKDGLIRQGLYSARHIRMEGEAHLIFVMQDVTHQKNIAEEHRKLEEQLFQSQKMDAIGQLASGVAHDFNNILTGIQGNASLMLLEYPTDHPHHRRLSRIEENVKRGANLTRQLLGFARGGKYEVKTADINQLLRKNARFFTETRKEIEADFQMQDNVFPVNVDAGQIEQVLINIYINAAHAMPGGGCLRIRTDNTSLAENDAAAFEIPAGDYVKISISDTGSGMDRATLQRIFEPFFTTRGKQGGTGLGLASAYGIIRNHGGAICAESEIGKGSTFTIYLPSSAAEIKPEDHETQGALVPGSGGVLLVDDEPMILGSVSEMLKMLGYAVYQTGSGQEAISLYMQKKECIDLVILDMILPGISGAQVLKFIKDIHPGVRVILSSGYSMQGEVRKVMDMGCAAFIQKPYSFADLSTIIRRVIHASGHPAA